MDGILWRWGRCLPRRWRRRWKREFLLRRPALYARASIRYEQSLAEDETQDLLRMLDASLDVPGDVIECGCFLCGTTVAMARHLQQHHSGKRIYACDTFAGFEPGELARARQAGEACGQQDYVSNDLYYVRRKLACLGVADRVILVPGLFQATLASLPGPFGFAFIDCDLHDSLLCAARTVWPRLAPGAGCLFDDYDDENYPGAARAVDRFLAEHTGEIRAHGRFSRKMYFVRKASPVAT